MGTAMQVCSFSIIKIGPNRIQAMEKLMDNWYDYWCIEKETCGWTRKLKPEK